MKKLFAVFLSCAVLLAAAGCKTTADNASSAPAESNAAVELSYSSVPGEETASVTPSTTTAAKKADIDGVNDVLDGIKNVPVGTAGSSLKCIAVSASTLKWTSEHTFDRDTITDAVKKYYNALDEYAKSDFAFNFDSIDSYARMIISGSEDAKGMLDSAGISIDFTVNADSYEIFSTAVRSVLA